MTKSPSDDGVQGEGAYAAARRFREAEDAFVKAGPVHQKAREAADALDDPQAARLDDRLKESFPASDPASASPGSD